MKFSATVTLQYDTVFSSFSAADYLKGLDWMKESRLDGAELCISNYNGLDLEKVKSQLDERGLGCSTLSTGQARGLEGLSLIGVSADVTARTQERFYQHINAAKILGSKVTIGLMRGLGSQETAGTDLKELAEAMKPVIDYADKKGVTLCLEAINRYETALLNSAEATVDFIENELGNPECVGILWDLFHANIEDIDFAHSIDIMGKKLKHVHIADSNRTFPGYGHTDFVSIMKKLKESGFEEYSSFECFNRPSLDVVLKDTGAWVQKMREL